MFSLKAFCVESEFAGIGTMLKKDGNKIFVLKVLPDSPAQRAALQDGSEIIEINGEKIRKYPLEKTANILRGIAGTTVELIVKENGKKRVINIERSKIEINKASIDERFIAHWKQVVPADIANMNIGHIYNNVRYSKKLQNEISYINYWENRKETFKNGYDACLTYSETEQNTCLMNLVNREIQKTEFDRQAELQERAMRQQAAQNFTNTMNQIQTNTNLNNINNSIQQQNLQLQNTNLQLYNINNSLRKW